MIRIDAVKKIAFVKVTGAPTHIEIQETIKELLEHPDYVVGMKTLWDFREASMVSFDENKLQKLGAFVRKNLPNLARRAAYVISNDIDYGVGRMWLAYAEIADANQERELFRTIEEAEAWLLYRP